MLNFILAFTITVNCLTFVSVEDTDEAKEDKIHDKIGKVSHSIDVNLRSISERLNNKESLPLAKQCAGLGPEDKKREVEKYLKAKVDELLNKVVDEVRELVVLSGSRERIVKAVAKHLGPDHMRLLASAAGGLFPWQDEAAAQLSSFAIGYLNYNKRQSY